MAVGEADIFEIIVLAAGADAFLGRRGARVFALLQAQENVLELIHPGVGEQQRGIVDWHKGRTAHDAMSAIGEKFQKCAADFVAGHRERDSRPFASLRASS